MDKGHLFHLIYQVHGGTLQNDQTVDGLVVPIRGQAKKGLHRLHPQTRVYTDPSQYLQYEEEKDHLLSPQRMP